MSEATAEQKSDGVRAEKEILSGVLSKGAEGAIAKESENLLLANEQHFLPTLELLQEENRLLQVTMARLQEEAALLREMYSNTSQELSNFKKPALLVADVTGMQQGKAIIRLPNGNKFYCYVAKGIELIAVRQPDDGFALL